VLDHVWLQRASLEYLTAGLTGSMLDIGVVPHQEEVDHLSVICVGKGIVLQSLPRTVCKSPAGEG
jgi:hypothetical protein